MNLPLITIGIATYNAQNTLEKAIQSALAQSWKKKEIIVVDDCSSDITLICMFLGRSHNTKHTI